MRRGGSDSPPPIRCGRARLSPEPAAASKRPGGVVPPDLGPGSSLRFIQGDGRGESGTTNPSFALPVARAGRRPPDIIAAIRRLNGKARGPDAAVSDTAVSEVRQRPCPCRPVCRRRRRTPRRIRRVDSNRRAACTVPAPSASRRAGASRRGLSPHGMPAVITDSGPPKGTIVNLRRKLGSLRQRMLSKGVREPIPGRRDAVGRAPGRAEPQPRRAPRPGTGRGTSRPPKRSHPRSPSSGRGGRAT